MIGQLVLAFIAFTLPLQADSVSPPKAYGRIELLYDRWGVPNVFSDTDPGAFYGLGYASAQERGFQMYYNLRIIQGRLAEVVGKQRSLRRRETTVDNDRKMRTFGFYRAAQRVARHLDPDTTSLLEAYCQGVNDYFSTHRNHLHPLFQKLNLQPEPWTPADCLASWWHLGQFFATDGTRELIRYRNLTRGFPRWRGRLRPPVRSDAWIDDSTAVVQRGDVSQAWLDRVRAFMSAHGLLNSSVPGGGPKGPKFSHAWVVGGAKTTTGAAVLVSDPQTPVRNPSLWIEFHVCGKTFNARGVGVPGSPGLLIGWNEHVAWGATALGADQADLFRLKTDPHHPNQYQVDGKWLNMEVRHETIRVKGGQPVHLTVRETRFGPVVTPFAFAAPGDPQVALKRVPICRTDRDTIQGSIAMMRAPNLKAFCRALDGWDFPSVNLVFGDDQGNIGYWLLAAIPVRSAHDLQRGSAAVDGSRSDMDWQGFVPHDLLPHVLNPARGWIASANHRAIGRFYPMVLGLSTGSAGHTVRSWRLYELLAQRDRFTPQQVLQLHYDTVNPARRDLVRAALHLRDDLHQTLSPDATRALAVLEPWLRHGAHSDLTSPGAALATEISTFFRFVNTPLAGKFGGGESGLTHFLRVLDARLASDPKAPLSNDEVSYIDTALADAWDAASRRFGADPSQWDRRARAAVASRRLGWFESLDNFPSPDPAGNLHFPPLLDVDGGTIHSQAAQSYTQFVPLNDPDAAQSILPPGNSDRLDSPFRTATFNLWADSKLHPAPLSRHAVDRIAVDRVVLSGAASATAAISKASTLSPLRVSANHRFLVRKDGVPFFWLGDTAWALHQNLSRKDVLRYLDDAAAKHFTVIQLMSVNLWALKDGRDYDGDPPYLDGKPWRLNPPYWNHLGWVIDEAGKRGLYVLLVYGTPARTDHHGPYVRTPAQAYAYGHAVGAFFRDKHNLIWSSGIDVNPDDTRKVGPMGMAGWSAMAEGVADGVNGVDAFDGKADYRATLMTYHPSGASSSATWFQAAPWLDFNGAQVGLRGPTLLKKLGAAYAKQPVKPVIDLEPWYEEATWKRPPVNAWEVRAQAYQAVFAGAFGHTYGHKHIYQFDSPGEPGGYQWRTKLDAPGRCQMQYLRRLMELHSLTDRIPLPGFVRAAPGGVAKSLQVTRRVAATGASDGSYALVYSPRGEPFEVDVTKLRSTHINAHWFDPRTGKLQDLAHENSPGPHRFHPPGKPGPGNDWVLVLDAR